MEHVVLVDAGDQQLGLLEKLKAHQLGLRHRAVSVCLFDEDGRWLVQQRAATKYHSPLKWANSCCGHPRAGETPLEAAGRRLFEELRLTTKLTPLFSFEYRAYVGSGLIEHEFDHVFSGTCALPVAPNPAEVASVSWWDVGHVLLMAKNSPEMCCAWFPLIVRQVLAQRPA